MFYKSETIRREIGGIVRSKEDVERIINNAGYCLLEDYYDEKGQRYVVIEDELGYKYDACFNNIRRGFYPVPITFYNPFVLDNIPIWLKLNNKTFELCEGNTYVDAQTKLRFHCLICDDYFYVQWNCICSNDQGCSVCGGMQTGLYHSLEYLRPDLMTEWNYEENDVLPSDVTIGSNKSISWKCSICDYVWKTEVHKRAIRGAGCPACSNPPKVLTDRTRLSMVFPSIATEWHPTKNGSLTPNDVFCGSGKRVWWQCSVNREHEWITSINNRTNPSNNNCCPICVASNGEDKIREVLNYYGVCFDTEVWFTDCPRISSHPLHYDFYIENMATAIEFQGPQHYQPVDFAGRGLEWAQQEFEEGQIRDQIKRDYCASHNIKLIEIPYWDFNNIENILSRELNLN
jgi:hypothetical protein